MYGTDSIFAPHVGDRKSIGGTDGIGIVLKKTGGTTSGLAVNSGFGFFHNGVVNKMVTTMSTDDDAYGAGYKVQDFIQYTDVKNYLIYVSYKYYYNAYYMTCLLNYNSRLGGYSGSAKLFYAHTWDSTSVTGIGLNGRGATISWSDNLSIGMPILMLELLDVVSQLIKYITRINILGMY